MFNLRCEEKGLLRARFILTTSNCKNSKLTRRRLEAGVAECQSEISCEIDSIPLSNSSIFNPKPPKAGAIWISAIGKFLLIFMREKRMR